MSLRLSGFFDESGKFHDHDVVSFCGLLGADDDWSALQLEWDRLLRRHGIASLHMSGGTLNFRRRLSIKQPALGKDARIKIILQFIKAIKDHIPTGIAVAIGVKDFQALPEHHKKELGGNDPYYFAFAQAMSEVYGYLGATPGSKANIICDDEEKYFVECYKLMARFKREQPALKKQFVSMCAGDDEEFPQLQAADLLAYITRNEAERKFLGVDYDFRELFEEFDRDDPAQRFMFSPVTAFWDKSALTVFCEATLRNRKKKTR